MLDEDLEDEKLSDDDSLEVDLDEVDAEFAETGESALGMGAADLADEETEDDEAPVRSKPKAAVVASEEMPSVESKRKERDELAEAMAAFLAKGGKIQAVSGEA